MLKHLLATMALVVIITQSLSMVRCPKDQIASPEGCINDCKSSKYDKCPYTPLTKIYRPSYCAWTGSGWKSYTHQCQACLDPKAIGVKDGRCTGDQRTKNPIAPIAPIEPITPYYPIKDRCRTTDDCQHNWQFCLSGKCTDNCARMRCAGPCRKGRCRPRRPTCYPWRVPKHIRPIGGPESINPHYRPYMYQIMKKWRR